MLTDYDMFVALKYSRNKVSYCEQDPGLQVPIEKREIEKRKKENDSFSEKSRYYFQTVKY